MATTTEVAQGRNATLSDKGGDAARTRERVFKIILDSVDETIDYNAVSGVYVGQVHPTDPRLICSNMSVRYEGDSRLVQVLTCSYTAFAQDGGADDKSQPPDIRPARISTSAAVVETPTRHWRKRTAAFAWGARGPAVNSVNDIYDGVTTMQPVVRITLTQFEPNNPTYRLEAVGDINRDEFTLGSLTIRPHQLLFNSLSYTPTVENWGSTTYVGWNAEYEFLYKRNPVPIRFTDADANEQEIEIGWDIAVPQTGWSVKAFDPDAAGAADDVFGQPLRHGDPVNFPQFMGMIVDDEGSYDLPETVAVGDKVRAMVKVMSYTNEGASQVPSGAPIALNDNGRPRKDTLDPIVYAYQVFDDRNLRTFLGLRLQ